MTVLYTAMPVQATPNRPIKGDPEAKAMGMTIPRPRKMNTAPMARPMAAWGLLGL